MESTLPRYLNERNIPKYTGVMYDIDKILRKTDNPNKS